MLKQSSLNEVGEKRILYLLAIISIVGYLIDMLAVAPPQLIFIINIIAIIIVFLTLILEHYTIFSKVKSFGIISYLLIINILTSHYLGLKINSDADILRSLLIICALLPISALVIGKKHAIYIFTISIAFIISYNLNTNNHYISNNIYMFILIIFGYSIGIYYFINLFELKTKNEQFLSLELKKNNNDITFLNSLAFEMVDFASENETIPKILKKIKKHTGAKFASFSIYDPKQQALILRSIEADGTLLKAYVKLTGKKILNTASPVTNKMYNEILEQVVGLKNSLTAVTFGAIPENISKSFRNLTGISHFYGMAHIISGKLYGTTMLAFKAKQSLPNNELLKSYAHLTALLLRRNLIEKQLQVSENKLRNITDNISDVIIRSNMELKTTYISPSIKKLTGDTPECFLKKSQEERYTTESINKINSIFSEEFEIENDPKVNKKRTRIIELELFKADGKKIHVSAHTSFMRDSEGNAIGVLSVIRDITKRKQAELALNQSEAKFRLLINSLGEGVMILDKKGDIVFSNPAAEGLMETESKQLEGSSIYDFLSKQDIQLVNKEIEKRNRGLSNTYEVEIISKKGNIRNIIITATPYVNNQISFQGSLVIFRDITEMKKSEIQLKKYSKELKQLNSDKDRFMQILAHDLKSPFNSIIGFSDLLLTNLHKYPVDEIEKQLTVINSISLKTFDLLNDLLLWSTSQSGNLPFNPEKLNFIDICINSIEEKKEQAYQKNITIKCLTNDTIYIQSDKNLLKTILRNLISNAIKFTHKNGRIDISAVNNEDATLVTVSDNGIGMSSEDISKLWNFAKPYTNEGTAKEKGTGLGLVLCKEFVEKHGGKIWAESKEGKGCSFKFTLPLGSL
ncbi:MAG: PAS domain S-box protein [Bacteroidota bacterium]